MTNEEAIDAIRRGLVVTRKMVADGLSELSREEMDADPNWDHDPSTDNWFKRQPEYWVARVMTERQIAEQQPFAEIALQAVVQEVLSIRQLNAIGGCAGLLAPDKVRYEEISSFSQFTSESHDASVDAIACWKERASVYVREHEGDTLWWGDPPEILGDLPFGSTKPRWRVYSRLRIGDAGLIAREVAECHAEALLWGSIVDASAIAELVRMKRGETVE